MSDVPPPYAQYPRNVPTYGTATPLQSLMDGYYAYGWLFLLHVALSLALFGASFALGPNGGTVYWAGLVVLMIVMGFVSYPTNAKVGYGAGWSKAQVVLACVAIAFGTVCYGIIGYIVLQTLAANHMKRYGVRSGCTGIRKKAVRERIAQLQQHEAGVPAAPSMDYLR